MVEKEGATFSCEVSHDEVPAQWFWEDSKLRPSDNVRIRQEGETGAVGGPAGVLPTSCPQAIPPRPRASLPFSAEWALSPGRTYILIYRRVLVENAGEIKFVAGNAESRAQLRVKGNGSPGQGMGWTGSV